ncbi:hypothetical protein N0V93_008235 [Gnomoniopsis smithogilvyi]|uniref:Uncharacterized protein n=1 Tax=Gnomoniopsis smithogilvyi TaxID=1191159 RepID=A0A9W8YNS3_9PEZI|nr:hypothetical protein N0V93_008235 [Gnomoniopsis smithogilvyi]
MYGEDAANPAPRREGDGFALIISGFPALGKSRLTASTQEVPELTIKSGDGRKEEQARMCKLESCGLEFPVYDIDSSRYKLGREPDVPAFMDIVNQACRIPNAILLVGAKWQFRQAMQNAGIEYLRLYPKSTLKVPWLRRQDSRLQKSQIATQDAEEQVRKSSKNAAQLRQRAGALTEDGAEKRELLENAEACEREASEWLEVQEFQSTEKMRHQKLRSDMDSYWEFWMEIQDGFPGEQPGNKVVFGSTDHLTVPGCIDAVVERFALCHSRCGESGERHYLRNCVEFGPPLMEWCTDYDSLE